MRRFSRGFVLLALLARIGSSALAQQDNGRSVEPPKAPAAKAMTEDQGSAILMELEQIRQLLEKQQERMARAAAQQPVQETPPEKVQMSVGHGWYSIGRADAPVTVVEFADYQCPFCRRFHVNAYAGLKGEYIDTGKVRFVSRDLPLDFHPFALKAAEAVRCAGDQSKYWEFRDQLLSSPDPPNDEVIRKTATNLSLDQNALQSCLASHKYKADVQKDASDAASLEISGTPTFVVARSAEDKLDGVRIVGAQPYANFHSAIEAVLKTSSGIAKDIHQTGH